MKSKISEFISDVRAFLRIYRLSRHIMVNPSFVKGFKMAKYYKKSGKELKYHLRPVDFGTDGKIKKFKK